MTSNAFVLDITVMIGNSQLDMLMVMYLFSILEQEKLKPFLKIKIKHQLLVLGTYLKLILLLDGNHKLKIVVLSM